MIVKKSNISKEILLNECLNEMKSIILSQINKKEGIYTISLNVYFNTQIKTMIDIFTNYESNSPLYQEALKMLQFN